MVRRGRQEIRATWPSGQHNEPVPATAAVAALPRCGRRGPFWLAQPALALSCPR